MNVELRNRIGSWRYPLLGAIVTALVFPFAAAFGVPWVFTYVQLPGVILFLLIGSTSVFCFVKCPLRPFVPKVVTFAFAILGLYLSINVIGFYLLRYSLER